MENNNIQNLTSTKLIEKNEVAVKGTESSIYVFGSIVILIVLVSFIFKFKRKNDFVPITRQDEYNQECEDIYNDYLKKKDWDMIKEILKDTSFSKDIHKRARKVLRDVGEL